MATEQQIEANRNNAKLSTGPRTIEGKGIVRVNALKHGLRADTFELASGEDPAEFVERLEGWNRAYAPRNKVEADLVRQAVVVSWKIDRAVRIENAAINQNVIDAVLGCECEDDDREALIQAASLALFDAGPKGERIRRYEFSLRREMGRILSELAKVRKLTPAIIEDVPPIEREFVAVFAGLGELAAVESPTAANGEGLGDLGDPLPAPEPTPAEPEVAAEPPLTAPAPNKANSPEPISTEPVTSNKADSGGPRPCWSDLDRSSERQGAVWAELYQRVVARPQRVNGTVCAGKSGSKPKR